jgi:tellurite resistance protein
MEFDSDLRALMERVEEATPASLADGSWLLPLVRHVLVEYSHTDVDVLSAFHEGLAGEPLIDARIAHAQRKSMLAGGLSAGAYAGVMAGALTTGGLFTWAALPTALASFAFDIYATARIQLRLGWDLAVLHEHPVDPRDEEHLLDLAQISYGVDTTGTYVAVAAELAPMATRLAARTAGVAGRVAMDVAMRTLGQQLVQRGLVRFAVPALGVPLCAGLNWATTGRIAANARRILRGHRTAREEALSLREELAATPSLLLQALLWIASADGRLEGVEVRLVDELSALLEGGTALPDGGLVARDAETWLEELGGAAPEIRRTVYEAAVRAAALDGVLQGEEAERLRRLAEACGVGFEVEEVRRVIREMKG